MKIFLSTLLLLFSFSSFANQLDPYVDYHKGQYEKAAPVLKALAENSDATAQYYLANLYLYGFGVKRNTAEGFRLMHSSAELGYLPAQSFLGRYYLQNKKDLPTALIWLQKAADQGDADAQMYTALCYLQGICAKKNPNLAKKYIIKAAQSGFAMAQYELAIMFLKTKHPKNKKLGRIWLKKSANKGYPEAISAMEDTGVILSAKKNKKVKNEDDDDDENSNGDNDEADAKEPTPLTSEQRWQLKLNALKKAKATLVNPTVFTAKEGEITITPKITLVDKSLIVQPKFCFLKPSKVPMDYIIATTLKQLYKKPVPNPKYPTYEFKNPIYISSPASAFSILSTRANYGNTHALFKLGQMYEKGIHVKQDNGKALQLFQRAAKRNYLKTQYMVGLSYLNGKGVPQNIRTARSWFHKAALRGSAEAQFVLGYMAEQRHEFRTAIAMYNLAAQNGLAIAKFRLAQLYMVNSIDENNVFRPNKDNFKIAHKLYKQAYKDGISDAGLALAYFNASYSASKKQQKQAFEIAEKLYDKDENNNAAALLLAILYDKGIGVSQDADDAIDIYERLAPQGNRIAAFMLGSHYYLNDKDEAKASEYLQRAAAQSNPYAFYNLAMLAHNGKGVTNKEQFISNLTKASKLGYHPASILLTDYYLLHGGGFGAEKSALKTIQDLAKNNNTEAQLKLGLIYQMGLFTEKNANQALLWYKKAADQGNAIARYALGYFYQVGDGVERDLEKAKHFYTAAIKQSYAPAMVALGFMSEMDWYNYQQAKKHYKSAAELENPLGNYDLALIYKYGKEVSSSERKAKKLLRRAKEDKKNQTNCH